MSDKDNSTLGKILSLITDEIGTTEVETIQSELKERWPSLADLEGAYVGKVLRHTMGNKQAAARLLNVDRKTLDRMIRRHNLN